MDDYTLKTKKWLDNRFKQTTDNGVYFAHQPIYGFRNGCCEPDLMSRYIRTYRIMAHLAHIHFDSLLDVGAAEGYKAQLVKTLFDADVQCCDLSEEACKRANEIYDLTATPADIHDLPYDDDQFDIALCSETLEHVSDVKKAVGELLRVSRKGIIITLPYEPAEHVKRNCEQDIPHGHIHNFDMDSFNYLLSEGYHVSYGKMLTSFSKVPSYIIEPKVQKYQKDMRASRTAVTLYNLLVPLIRRGFNKRTMAFFFGLDTLAANLSTNYDALIFIILKDSAMFKKHAVRKVKASQILNFSIPYYYLKT